MAGIPTASTRTSAPLAMNMRSETTATRMAGNPSAPRRSNCPNEPEPAGLGRIFQPMMNAGTMKAILTKKTARQLAPSTSAPPTGGPSPAATPMTAPRIPKAIPLLASGTASRINAPVFGVISAPEAPCMTRNASSIERF